jgi:hypothetical protein
MMLLLLDVGRGVAVVLDVGVTLFLVRMEDVVMLLVMRMLLMSFDWKP